jgi:hypothetical protein
MQRHVFAAVHHPETGRLPRPAVQEEEESQEEERESTRRT